MTSCRTRRSTSTSADPIDETGQASQTNRARPPSSFGDISGWANRGSRTRGLLLVLTATGVLAWLAHVVDIGALGAAFGHLTWHTLLAAGLITACLPLILGLRLRLILRSHEIDPGWKRCTCIVLGIHPMNVVSPARLGDGLRIVALRQVADTATVIGLVVGERLLDVAMLAGIATFAGLIGGRPELAAIAVALLLLAGGIVALAALASRLSLPKRLAPMASRLASGLLALRRSPPHLLGAFVLTLLHWSLTMTLVSVLFTAVGSALDPLTVATVMPLAIFAGMLPVTLGGFGTREAALVALLAGQVAAPDALAAGLLYSLFTYVLLGAFGLLFTRRALRY